MKYQLELVGLVDAAQATTVLGYLELWRRREDGPPLISIDGELEDLRLVCLLAESLLSVPVHTRCLGRVGGLAAFLAACGDRGHRSAQSSTVFCLSGPTFDTGPASVAERLFALNPALTKLFPAVTGRSPWELMSDIQQRRVLTARQAVEYGFIDELTDSR